MAEYHSIKTIDEALFRTVTLLWPPSPGIWLRIALIGLFLGGGITFPLKTENLGVPDLNTRMIIDKSVKPDYLNLLITIGGGLFIACLLYVVMSAILQFVFVDCLSSGKILLSRTFRLRLRKGSELMLLYLLLFSIIILATVLLTFLIIIPNIQSGILDPVPLLFSVVEMLVLLLIILIPVWICAILVADFIVPIMILDESSLVPAARTFFAIFAGRWKEAGIYTGLKIFLIFTLGIIIGMITFLLSFPLGLADTILPHTRGHSAFISTDIMIRIGFETAAMILISLLLLVPVITFFRYYSLAVLRELDPVRNLLPPL
jgi:hypothetical protein